MDKNNKTVLKPGQKQMLKKYAVFVLMFLVFGGSLWLIFKPSGAEKNQKASNGLNTNLPMPQEKDLVKDKISAFEQATLFQQKPVRSLDDFSSLIEKDEPSKSDLLPSAKTEQVTNKKYSGSKQPQKAIQSSASAYKNINKTLDNFYEKPKVNSENEKLKEELEALKQQLAEKQQSNGIDEQLMLMEKSYQMAAKYMPGSSPQVAPTVETKKVQAVEKEKSKDPANLVLVTKKLTVSALKQTISDSAFIQQVSQPRNTSFITAGNIMKKDRKTIRACINNSQKLVNGQNVKLRLLEPVETGGFYFTVNSLITGIAQIQGERLQIIISSLEQNGNIIPVQLSAYDTDGQAGLFIPKSAEVNALKEITASMGRDAGTSISINQGTTAGEQLAADVGRSFIQGTSQYVSKKLRTTNVTLKAGHRLLLMPAN